jgi:FtsP/CotA-like multicopper oxidase with cupredoxin domain
MISDDELSIHWHGILLDPLMDGVPYVTTPPIYPGKSFTFKFKLRQHGTYWYHSHTNVQEQKGIFGAIVIHPKIKQIKYDRDLVVVLSDWTDENPSQVLKNLKKDGDYYLYKKNTVRSLWGAYQAHSLNNYLMNQWTRMGGMDLSDVGYDAFLSNGKKDSQGSIAKKGEKIRLRIINAAASSYFHVSIADLPMNIISLDGVDIKPTPAKDFLIGMAETFDVLFEVPAQKSYELKATAQDGTGFTSSWIGEGEKIHAPVRALPDQYASMDHAQMDHSGMHHGDHHNPMVIPSFSVNDAEAKDSTEFPNALPRHDVKLVLDGSMERYVWYINGKAIHQERNIVIQQNEVVRFTFVNKTMMHHPMHLHGHFFRVLNKHGENSPLKHTVDVAPHTTKTIEFYSNEPGEWMLHCHNLYHLKVGMARVVKYSSFTPEKDIQHFQKHDPHLHDHLYYRGMLEAATNHTQAQLNLMNTWNELELRTELRNDFGWQGEGDALYKRWIGRWFNLIVGGTLVKREGAAVAGFGYVLPFLLHTHTLIDHEGRMRLDLSKRFQWTKTIYSNAEFTFRQKQASEFEVTLMYQKYWDWSAGLMLTEHSAGLGAQYNF